MKTSNIALYYENFRSIIQPGFSNNCMCTYDVVRECTTPEDIYSALCTLEVDIFWLREMRARRAVSWTDVYVTYDMNPTFTYHQHEMQ